MLIDTLQHMDFWGWMTLALVFIIIELITMTTYILWLGIGAALIAAAKLFVVFPPNYDWALFSIASLVSLGLTYRWFKKNPQGKFETINQRGREYIGQTLILQDGIVANKARILLDGVWWSLVGPVCAPGTRVRVIKTDGNVLVVDLCAEKIETNQK